MKYILNPLKTHFLSLPLLSSIKLEAINLPYSNTKLVDTDWVRALLIIFVEFFGVGVVINYFWELDNAFKLKEN